MTTLSELVLAEIVTRKLEGKDLVFLDAEPMVFDQLLRDWPTWPGALVTPCLDIHNLPVYRLSMKSALRFCWRDGILVEEFVELPNDLG